VLSERKLPSQENTAEEIIKQMEKEIHQLLEQSAQLSVKEPFLALEKAKEAAMKDTILSKHREDSSQGYDLTFASRFHLAVTYEKNGMLLDAIETYSFLLKQKRYEVWAVRIRSNMGNLYYLQQNYTDAVKMYRMALDQTTPDEKPLRFHIHRTIGNILVEIGKLRDAILDYEAVSMSTDADIETCFNLLLCYAHIGDVEKTKMIFLKMLTISNTSKKDKPLTSQSEHAARTASAEERKLHHEQEKSGKDIVTLLFIVARLVCSMDHGEDWKIGYQWVHEQLIEKYYDMSQQIEMEQALQHLRQNEFESAIKILKSFESKDVDMRAMVATNLSFVYSLEGNLAVADEYADIALTSNRFNPNALVNKGNNLYITEKYSEAKELYLEAIGVDSTNFEAIYNLGLANKRLGLTSEAVQAFEKLHSIITNDPRVLHHVASLYEHNGDLSSAIKWFNVLSACLPNDPGVLFRVGNLCAEEDGDHTRCLHYCLESYELFPSLDVVTWLAIWFVKHEMYEKSVHFFRRASQIQPSEIKWNDMIASCLKQMGTGNDAFDL